MSASTEYEIQAAFISYLKSKPTLTSQFTGVSGTEIRENQWQGSDFVYPALRIYVDVIPSVNGCGPDTAMVCLDAYSEQKSSRQSKLIAQTLVNVLHKKRFKAGGLDFPMVRVTKTDRAVRTIYAWVTRVNVTVLVNSIGAINASN